MTARIMCAMPRSNRRVSPDSAWPLRRADGTPWHAQPRQTAPKPADRFQPADQYERMNRPSWGVAAVIAGLLLAVWALSAVADPRFRPDGSSPQAVSPADAASIANAGER